MAPGDVINGTGTAGVTLNFQPAVGVEVVLTSFAVVNEWVALTDGVNIGKVFLTGDGSFPASSLIGNSGGSKLCITNSNYLQINGSGGNAPQYSGLQIK
jgi:hypothetical protein